MACQQHQASGNQCADQSGEERHHGRTAERAGRNGHGQQIAPGLEDQQPTARQGFQAWQESGDGGLWQGEYSDEAQVARQPEGRGVQHPPLSPGTDHGDYHPDGQAAAGGPVAGPTTKDRPEGR